MNHTKPAKSQFAILAAAAIVSFCQSASAAPPNVVFFLVDDLGWKDVGCQGSSFYETPHVDSLARDGMRFTQAYAACPVCSPTRAAILTGKYPQRTGITDYIGAAQPDKWRRNTPLLPAAYREHLPHEETTLAEAFQSAGYATFFAGKWHLGAEPYWPETQGFDHNLGGIDRGGPYGGKKYFSPYGNPRLKDGPPGEHLPDRLASEAAAFIETNRDKPFFAYISFYSVHTPLIARDDLRRKYEAKAKTVEHNGPDWGQEGERRVRRVQDHAVYAAMVEAMDLAVGKVLAKLDELELAENTIVVFTSDNGGLSTSEGHPTSNLPLRGGKGWLYEGGVREPLLVRWPSVVQAGTESEAIVTSCDFYPTLLAAADLPAIPKQHVDGTSFLPALRGEAFERGPVYWHYPHYGNQGGSPGGAVRDGRWKLIEHYGGETVELFDLASDVGEANDVSTQQPDRVKAMQAKLAAWRKDVDAKMPTPNPIFRAAPPPPSAAAQ